MKYLIYILLCFVSCPESHQEDYAEGRGGGEDCDGGACDHRYPFQKPAAGLHSISWDGAFKCKNFHHQLLFFFLLLSLVFSEVSLGMLGVVVPPPEPL